MTTAPEDPSALAVRGAVGDASWEQLQRFSRLLIERGEPRGVIGPREVPRLWSRHIVNSMAVNSFIPRGARVADVGSGAGFPGIVVAVTRPDLHVVCIEAMERRCAWLDDVVSELDLRNVDVVAARAEDVRDEFDVVTARAVAGLDTLARWTLPLVRRGGVLLALKGERAAEEVQGAGRVLRRLGAGSWEVHEVVSPLDGSVTRVVEVRR